MANTTGKKFGGREKGTPNKEVSEIRDAFKKLIEGNIDQLEMDLAELSPEKRINAVINLASYVLPKLKQIEVDNKNETYNMINLGSGVDPEKPFRVRDLIRFDDE
jgi:hypothetical protein